MFSESSNIASEWYSYNIGLKFYIGVEYPKELNKYVLRGLFDKNGSISQRIDKNSTLMCVIKVHPQLHKIYLQTLEIVGIPFADENIMRLIFYQKFTIFQTRNVEKMIIIIIIYHGSCKKYLEFQIVILRNPM